MKSAGLKLLEEAGDQLSREWREIQQRLARVEAEHQQLTQTLSAAREALVAGNLDELYRIIRSGDGCAGPG